MKMKHVLGAALVASGLAACGGSDKPAFPQPTGTVAVNFTVDDTANKLWKDQELEWKGNVLFDSTTRKGTFDSTWGGPWAKLYDDGPWDKGGHEPKGATAGDHKLGVTVFVTPPASGTQDFEYGLRDATNPDTANGGWVWAGSNGKFTLTAGSTTEVTAAGMTFPAHGTTDLKLTLNTNQLDAGGTWTTAKVEVKGSGWGWTSVHMYDDGTHGDATAGDKIYTFVLSQAIDQAKPPYPGLLKAGDRAEFVFELDGKEYKVSSVCSKAGVTAGLKAGGAAGFTDVTSSIAVTGGTGLGSGNTYVTVP